MRRSNNPYNYEAFNIDNSRRNTNSRRNLPERISVGNLDSMAGSSGMKRNSRSSSNERSDYNIDINDSQEAPGINTHSAVFSPPINEKGGGIQRANNRGDSNPFEGSGVANSKFIDISPIKANNKLNNNQSVRPSDLEIFNGPFNSPISPAIHNSSVTAKGFQTYQKGAGLVSESDEDNGDFLVRDSDDLRGRKVLDDRSPHNREARPRSSIMKKEWNMAGRESDESTPKQVRFARGTKVEIEQNNLDKKLQEEINRNENNFKHDVRTSYPDDQVNYSREVSRQELVNRVSRSSNENIRNYNMGKRLRSNERLNSTEREYERTNISQEPEIIHTKPIRTAMNDLVTGSSASRFDSRTTPPRSFGMKGIVKTEYSRYKLPGNRDSENSTIPELPSKYEESRDEISSTYQKSNGSIANSSVRNRSPFNVSNQPNTSYVKDNIETRRSPVRNKQSLSSGREFYEIDEGTTVLKGKSKNIERNETYLRDTDYIQKPNSPSRIDQNYIRHEQRERVPNMTQKAEYISPVRSPERRQSPRSRPSPRQSPSRRSPIHSPGRISPIHSPMRRSPAQSPNHRSPRERPMGSPPREQKKHDVSTENNIVSRFISNKIINKTVEDLVFNLVPEFFEEARNPMRNVTTVKRVSR